MRGCDTRQILHASARWHEVLSPVRATWLKRSVNSAEIRFSAVLLAGGKSTRMGCEKALLEIDGEPLWQRQLATLRACGPAELLVSQRPDGVVPAAGVTIVHDAAPGLGPLGGVAASLRAARHPFLLVLAIDLPQMRPDFLRELAETAVRTGRGIVPLHGERFEPLAAIYPRGALALAELHLQSPDRSMQRFIRAALELGLISARELREPEPSLFQNVNRPADLE